MIASAVGTKLTHPDKVVYPGTAVTKAILATYYAAVAEKMLPHIADRPLSLAGLIAGCRRTCSSSTLWAAGANSPIYLTGRPCDPYLVVRLHLRQPILNRT